MAILAKVMLGDGNLYNFFQCNWLSINVDKIQNAYVLQTKHRIQLQLEPLESC
jgi:hypothetical protein